jgi:hypothetical protein
MLHACMELLDADSCRGTVPMEPPMSNGSMLLYGPFIYKKKVLEYVLRFLVCSLWGSLHTKSPPYDFLNLYVACLYSMQAPGIPKVRWYIICPALRVKHVNRHGCCTVVNSRA